MWLLGWMQSREMPTPSCLQVTGVAADRRRKGTGHDAIGHLLGNGQHGVCISRGRKGVSWAWYLSLGAGGEEEEEGGKISTGCREGCPSCKADLVAIVL